MKKLWSILIALSLCCALFASDLYNGTSIAVQGAAADTYSNVTAQIDINGKFAIGGFLEMNNGFYGAVGVSYRLKEKQYSNFLDVPKALQLNLGAGWVYKNESFMFSADLGLSLIKTGSRWSSGIYLEVTPKYIVQSPEVLHFGIGFPIQIAYTGIVNRISVGVSVGYEIYEN